MDAVFWLSARKGVTELYLIQGTIKDGHGKEWQSKKYLSFRNGVEATSIAWDADAYKIRIAGLYHNLVKLMDQAGKDWNQDIVKKTYASVRKQGWRKRLRK